MRTCVLVADVGPNPAPLAEAIWALARKRDLRVRAAHLVTMPRGVHYLDLEFLAPGAALDQLNAVLGPEVLATLDVTTKAPDGSPLDEESTAEETARWSEARFAAARAAIAAAGDDPVVFAFVAGRRRSMTASLAVVAQLLARPADLCIDIRVTDPRVEGGTGFFFPEQAGSVVGRDGRCIDPATVDVVIVDLPMPRLRGLLREADLASFTSALAAGQQALDSAAPPTLVVNLVTRSATVDGHPLSLGPATFVVLAGLALARTHGDGWVRTQETAPFAAAMRAMRAHHPHWWPTSTTLQDLLGGANVDLPNLTKLKSDLRKALRRYCEARGRDPATLVPALAASFEDGAKVSRQRLPVEPERLTVEGYDP